jgi:hypothetical protein
LSLVELPICLIWDFYKGVFAMFKRFVVALAAVTVCGLAARADDTTTLDVYFATEHVPVGLKAGNRVDLMKVMGKTVTPAGKVNYTAGGLAQNLEVVSVAPVPNPKTPEEAVKVELRVTNTQAKAIQAVMAKLVSVTEATSDGQTKTVSKAIPLRLEPAKLEQKR